MKHLALILSIALLLVADANAAPVIFLVRHAEKASAGGNDPDLSLAGQKRADALARLLGYVAHYRARPNEPLEAIGNAIDPYVQGFWDAASMSRAAFFSARRPALAASGLYGPVSSIRR